MSKMKKPTKPRAKSSTPKIRREPKPVKEPAPALASDSYPLLLDVILRAAFEKKAENVILLDLRSLTTVADYFVLCSGSSSAQRRAIRDVIRQETSKVNEKVWHVEEDTEPEWILMDYVDIVVHIFDPEKRLYYDLEHLWGDAPMRKLETEDDLTGTGRK